MPIRVIQSSLQLTLAMMSWVVGLLIFLPASLIAQSHLPIQVPFPDPGFGSEMELDDPSPIPGQSRGETTSETSGLTVRDCIGIALQNQPSLKAIRASIASAEASYRSLCNTPRFAARFAPDLEARKAQALKGIEANQAELAQAEWDTVYAVTRTYYAVVYAREQLVTAEYVDASLMLNRTLIKDLLEAGGDRNLNETSLHQIDIYLSQIRQKQEEARGGIARAVAALREAMGVNTHFPIEIPEQRLPELDLNVSQEYIISATLGRRGELALAQIAADVFDLEAFAQASLRRRRSYRTIAQGADLHARPIPQRNFGENYRPGGVGVEMPPSVYGTTGERVAKIHRLTDRSRAVYEKTCNLLTLEASDALARWEQSSKKLDEARVGYDAGVKMLEFAQISDFLRDGKQLVEIALSKALVGQAIAAFNESHFEAIVALADLERVTAGGVQINWPPPLPLRKLPENGGNGNGNPIQ